MGETLHIIAFIAVIVNVVVGLALLVLLGFIFFGKGHNGGANAKDIERIMAAERAASAAVAADGRLRREMERSLEGVADQLRHMTEKVDDLIADRATLIEVDQRTVTLEQLYNSLNATVIEINAQLSGRNNA